VFHKGKEKVISVILFDASL